MRRSVKRIFRSDVKTFLEIGRFSLKWEKNTGWLLVSVHGYREPCRTCRLHSKAQRKAVQAAKTPQELREALGEGKWRALIQEIQYRDHRLAEKWEGESRPKETEEVSEKSDDPSVTAEQHGGDGNSLEVDAEAETSSEEADAADSDQPGGQGEESDSDSTASGHPSNLSQRSGEASDRLLHQQEMRRIYGQPGKNSGGHEGSLAKASFAQPIENFTEEACKPLIKSLQRLFRGFLEEEPSDDIDGILESPRVDGRKLVRELVSKRYALGRARKEELSAEPRRIIIAADTSGSCSASSGATVGICEAITRVWPEVMFVNHANGWIHEITEGGVTSGFVERSESFYTEITTTSSAEKWVELSKNAVGAIFFGDADGIEIWSCVWEQNQVSTIWLDSYRASYGVVKAKNPQYQYDIGNIDTNTVQYYIGVNSPSSAAVAVRKALRK